MTRLEERPWSQAREWEDEAPPRDEAASCADAGPSVENPRELRRWPAAASWALVPLSLAALWMAWSAIRGPASSGLAARLEFGGAGLLVLLAGAIVWMAEQSRRADLVALRYALSRIDGGLEFDCVREEWRPVLQAAIDHSASLRDKIQRLEGTQQRVGLERRLADLQRQQVDAIVNGISDAVIVTDEFDRLLMANRACESVLGLKPAEAMRKAITELEIDEGLTRMIRQSREAEGGNVRRHVEHALGDRIYEVTLSGVSVQQREDSVGGPKHGVLAVLRDVTREKEIAKAKSDFVSKVAHELRTPLSSIKAYVEMLVDGEATDEKTLREYYEIIQSSSERLSRLIDNMLNISRIESGTVRVNKEPVSMAVVVKEAADVARPQAEAKQIKLDVELTPVFYQVLADRDMIYQAVLNLLSNAVKYTPEGGSVTVKMSVMEQERTVTISVSDTGVGIPEQDLPRLFEKFFRVEANSKMAKGTGLGLNLVKHLVETVHGGRMGVTSKVGTGSSFSMTLPLHG